MDALWDDEYDLRLDSDGGDANSDTSDTGIEEVDGNAWTEFQRRKATTLSEVNVPLNHRIIDYVYIFGDQKLKPGMSVELLTGDYLRIVYITKNPNTKDYTLHGLRLQATKRISNQLRKKIGELCLDVEADVTDKRPDFVRALEEYSLGTVIAVRNILFTNKRGDAFREELLRDPKQWWESGRLVCRWKHIRLYTASRSGKGVVVEEALTGITEAEADDGCSIPDAANILRFVRSRPKTVKQSSTTRASKSTSRRSTTLKRSRDGYDGLDEIEEIEEQFFRSTSTTTAVRRSSAVERRRRSDHPNAQYTYGDYCCGAGGAAGAADEAGLKVVFGVDKDEWASRSFQANWPEAKVYHMHCGEFVQKGHVDSCVYAHVVHFSLPCRFFSPNHTRAGKDDEDVLDTNLGAEEALHRLRPRFCTMEQTFGLKHKPHRQYFDAMVKQFTDIGYNVRLRIETLNKYNSPHARRRLIVIASWYNSPSLSLFKVRLTIDSPGEPLPEFPPPIRGPEYGKLPYMTVREALAGIDTTSPLHNPEELRREYRKRPSTKLIPAKWDEPLQHIIDTTGPKCLHPDGDRRFTTLEGMMLLRFRMCHQIVAPNQTKQWWLIGNAVPRDLPTLIDKSFIRQLKKSDRKIEEYLAQCSRNAVSLDESEDAASRSTARIAVPEEAAGYLKRPSLGAEIFEISDSDGDEALPEIPLRARAVNARPLKKQRTINDDFVVNKKAHPNSQTPAKHGSPLDVVDSIEDHADPYANPYGTGFDPVPRRRIPQRSTTFTQELPSRSAPPKRLTNLPGDVEIIDLTNDD